MLVQRARLPWAGGRAAGAVGLMTGRLMTGRLGVGIPVLALLVTSPVAAAPKPSPSATARPLAVRLADSVLARWPDPTTISGKGFEYTDGIVLRGLAEVYGKTRDPRYLAYIRRWVDAYLREDGSRRDARSESGRRYGAGGAPPPPPPGAQAKRFAPPARDPGGGPPR